VTTIHKKVCPNIWVIETPKKIIPIFIFIFFEEILQVKIRNGHGSIEKFRIPPIFW
jgi:hypothetical protein